MSFTLISLENFVGNSGLRETFARIKLPSVSLFTGPSGVGKKTLAVSLAARLHCSASEQRPCLACSSCLKIQGRNHPDTLIIDREWVEITMKNAKKRYNPRVITIDVSRALVREAQYMPFESEHRIFILDDIDKLNSSASNALLRTLEEPLATTHFVLVTAHPELLLPTILSRCQRFAFRSLHRSEVEAHLRVRGLDSPEMRGGLAQGSIGRALDLNLEQVIADRDQMFKLLEAWCRRPVFAAIFKACHEKPLVAYLKDRERTLDLLEQLSLLGEDLYFLVTQQRDRVVSQDRMDELEILRDSVTLDWIERFLYHVGQSAENVRRYITPLVCFETLWLESLNKHA